MSRNNTRFKFLADRFFAFAFYRNFLQTVQQFLRIGASGGGDLLVVGSIGSDPQQLKKVGRNNFRWQAQPEVIGVLFFGHY